MEEIKNLESKENKEHMHTISSEQRIIEERKEKVLNFFKSNPSWIFYVILIGLVILGVYIRVQPMLDHGGKPGLWDITTNTWTLGPDLDPFLFLRYAKTMIETGSLPKTDIMRNVPAGFDPSTELQMVSYMIVLTYKLVNMFGDYSVNFAGVLMPALFFLLTIISFFLFVREVFIRKDKKESKLRANLIAIISTAFMIVIPAFLQRTVAGIPEKESIAFFFMFLAFYFFLKAWKSDKIIYALILSVLAGASTGLMGLTWGGVSYIYTSLAIACFLAFLLNKVKIKETIIIASWIATSIIITLLFTKRFSLIGIITGLDTGIIFFILFAVLVHFILWKKFGREIKIRIPHNLISLIVSAILAAILVSVIFGPSFLLEKISYLNQIFFTAVQGRWVTTVAENRQPFFTEWASSLGPVFKGIPLLFWMFFIGSIALFKETLNKIRKKDAWILTLLYILFFFGLVFSRYSSSSIFNGENFISKIFYYASALLLIGMLVYYYILYYRENDQSLEQIDYDYIFIFSLLILSLFTARSAVRLIMVIAIIAPIFSSYLLVKSIELFRKDEDKTKKLIIGIIMTLLIIANIFGFWTFYKDIKQQAYYNIPYYYTFQWQNAMSWVRENTPANSVFAHWWDYGYWVQSIGERATVTDGANVMVWWNYLTGRLVLTGDNQKDALNFLYSHNATHLLIDSSDIGKYGAFSQIGSDENYDRLSQGPVTFFSDSKQVQETKTGIIRTYNMPAGNGRVSLSPLEEDIIYENESSKTAIFKENSGVMGIIIKYSQVNDSAAFEQPLAVFASNGKQITLPLRYLYYNGKFVDFGSGINATAYIIQLISSNQLDNLGAVIYISPRVMRGFLGQVYLLNDPLNNFPNFKLIHSEPDYVLDSLSKQGTNLREFVYYQGLKGPIKIWSIDYTGEEEVKKDYLLTQPPSYITWKF